MPFPPLPAKKRRRGRMDSRNSRSCDRDESPKRRGRDRDRDRDRRNPDGGDRARLLMWAIPDPFSTVGDSHYLPLMLLCFVF